MTQKPKGWKREPFGGAGKGWVYRNGKGMTVMPLGHDRCGRWFISFGLSFAADKRGTVRLFWTAAGAMKAADKLKGSEMRA
jgi:hypothetical protein